MEPEDLLVIVFLLTLLVLVICGMLFLVEHVVVGWS